MCSEVSEVSEVSKVMLHWTELLKGAVLLFLGRALMPNFFRSAATINYRFRPKHKSPESKDFPVWPPR